MVKNDEISKKADEVKIKIEFKQELKYSHEKNYHDIWASLLYTVIVVITAVIFILGLMKLIKTGIALEVPVGYAGLIYARSGLASKKGLAPANKVGVVDSDYRGEVMVALHNHSSEDKTIEPNERIAQFVIAPYLKAEFEEVDSLDDTTRGSGGFGSTGTK